MEPKFEKGDSVYDRDDVTRYVQGHVVIPKKHTVTRVKRASTVSGGHVYFVDHGCEPYRGYQLGTSDDALKVALEARSQQEVYITTRASKKLRGILWRTPGLRPIIQTILDT